MALRVLMVDEDPQRAEVLRLGLQRAGCEVVGTVSAGVDLLARVRELAPDVIIIDRESPDRDTLEHVCIVTRDEPRPIVLFTPDDDGEKIRAAVKAGVSAYVVGGLEAERVRPILDAAVARFGEFQALREELDRTRTTLAERKLIERAKGIVMKSRGVSEDEAYALLRRMAMDRNERLGQVAANVIAMAELLT